MHSISPERVLDRVLNFFIESNDFNGITLTGLSEKLDIPYLELIEIIKDLVSNEFLSVQSSTNPHIIGLGHYPVDAQLVIIE